MASNPQVRKIYATAKELGLDNELLHSLVLRITGKEHISDLSIYDAVKVIDSMEPSSRKKPVQQKKIPNRASKEQIWKIQRLAKELGWNDNPKRLLGFVRKFAKVDAIKWLTPWQASNVIEGMKKVVEREAQAQ